MALENTDKRICYREVDEVWLDGHPLALVERVRVSAERHAVLALDAVTMAVPRILGVALRRCPQLPRTIAERIKDYHAQNVADWVMYRKASPLRPRHGVGPSTGTTRRAYWVRRARRCV
jgi:hypothetical protein